MYLQMAFRADFDKNCQFGQSNSLKSSSRCRYRAIQEKLTRKHYFQLMTKIWNFSIPKLHNWASALQTQIWWKGPCRRGFSDPKNFKCTWISWKFTCSLEDPSKSHIQIFCSNGAILPNFGDNRFSQFDHFGWVRTFKNRRKQNFTKFFQTNVPGLIDPEKPEKPI